MSGLPIDKEKAKEYLAIVDGQHRYMAIMALREEDSVARRSMKKQRGNGEEWKERGR